MSSKGGKKHPAKNPPLGAHRRASPLSLATRRRGDMGFGLLILIWFIRPVPPKIGTRLYERKSPLEHAAFRLFNLNFVCLCGRSANTCVPTPPKNESPILARGKSMSSDNRDVFSDEATLSRVHFCFCHVCSYESV